MLFSVCVGSNPKRSDNRKSPIYIININLLTSYRSNSLRAAEIQIWLEVSKKGKFKKNLQCAFCVDISDTTITAYNIWLVLWTSITFSKPILTGCVDGKLRRYAESMA